MVCPRRVPPSIFASAFARLRAGAAAGALAVVAFGCGGHSATLDGGAQPDAQMVGDGAVATDGAPADAAAPARGASVITHHNSRTRDGMYVEPSFTRAAVATTAQDTGFSATIAGPTYAQPLYYDAGPGGTDLVIVATETNNVYALNAQTGGLVWKVALGTPVPRSDLPCGDIDPLGITGTPYLDLASRTIYLDAMELKANSTPKHFIYALSLDDGSTRSGWPVNVNATVSYGGTSFVSKVQNQRGAVLLEGGILYVPYGGHDGDCGNYHGWVVGVPVDDPQHPQAWATRATESGSWAPGGVASDGTDMYVATGNAPAVSTPTWSDQEAIIRFTPGPVFSKNTKDYFTPSNWMQLDAADADLGGSGPVLIHVPGASPADLAVALGKDSNAYLIDLADMGGQGGQVAKTQVATNRIITAASAYPATGGGVDVTFQASGSSCPGSSGDVTTIHVTAASPPKIETAWCATEGGRGEPIVTTTDGHSQSIVWTIGSESSEQLRAFNGDTGKRLFSSATISDTFRRFVSPIVAKGRIYVASDKAVYMFRPM